MRRVIKFGLLSALVVAISAPAMAQEKTLDAVKKRGVLNCAVNVGLPGFSQPDDKGNWTGLDVDYCKAIAAAVLGDPNKVKYIPTTAKERFTALQSGEADVLVRNTTWSLARDSSLGLSFVGVNYYDGQGFMVKKSLGVTSAKELDGATVCVQTGTTTELNLADYFRTNNMKYQPVVFEKAAEIVQAYQAGRCDVFTTDASGLYAERLQMQNPDEHIVLPEIISKEPLGPSVRQGDSQWFTIVKWVHFALVNAEELGITQANVEEMKSSQNPEIRRFVGVEGDFGQGLGLDNDWAVRIIKAVGNYGEIFDRNVGKDSRLKIERGLNALWNQGGLQYAPPIR
ncbi:MAG: amino acid ABC transporter substrate-binding protein [Proteobacteria bacterium]|jgi:general L-amino acid transport system substrate-binding protein|nr:MAG: amino acid ABC transporter substrate-binding protein [Pseudomonadota bacterium]